MSVSRRVLLPAELRTQLSDQIGIALALLRRDLVPNDEAIHEARKALKRSRAILRLLRRSISKGAYVHEDTALRDCARPLGQVRDSKVLYDVLERLLAHYKKHPVRTLLFKRRNALRAERTVLLARLTDGGELKAILKSLAEAQGRINAWEVAGTRARILGGFRRIYRKARRLLANAKSDGSDENLHELRKQAKYLAESMKILAPGGMAHFKKWAKNAAAIGDGLGDDHDLAVLLERIGTPGQSTASSKALFIEIGRRRGKLQQKALKKACDLLRSKPGTFVSHLH